MLTLSQMVLRLFVAVALGAFMGFERERLGKEAGFRTAMLVAAGACIFTMVSIIIPYFAQVPPEELKNTIPDRIVSNIVVGIGFLGAGIILKKEDKIKGLTTAALIWAVAAVGMLVGLGLIEFAAISALTLSGLLYLSRRFGLSQRVRGGELQE